jgi:hypothetical protein
MEFINDVGQHSPYPDVVAASAHRLELAGNYPGQLAEWPGAVNGRGSQRVGLQGDSKWRNGHVRI